jgi:hypothetical protein
MTTWTGTITTRTGRVITDTDLVNASYDLPALTENAEVIVLATAAADSPAAAQRVAQHARVISTSNQGFSGIRVYAEFADGRKIHLTRSVVRPTGRTRRSYASLAAEYGTTKNGTLHPTALDHIAA